MSKMLDLFEQRKVLKSHIATLKKDIDRIDTELEEAYLTKAKDILATTGKDFGTVYIPEGNQEIKAVVTKKVEWDQGILMKALNEMSEEDAQHYAKMTLAVDERKYTAAPPHVRRILEPARTTRVGSFSVEVKEE